MYFSLHYSCFKQIIFDSLFGKEPNAKVRLYAVQFVHHVCLWSSDKIITMMGPVLLNGMTKLISEDKQVWERENSLFLNVFCVCSVLKDRDRTINNKCSAVCISCRIPKYSIWPKDKVCKSFYNDFVGSLAGSKTKKVGIYSNWKTGKVSFQSFVKFRIKFLNQICFSCYLYFAIRRIPVLFCKDVALIQRLFQALCQVGTVYDNAAMRWLFIVLHLCYTEMPFHGNLLGLKCFAYKCLVTWAKILSIL